MTTTAPSIEHEHGHGPTRLDCHNAHAKLIWILQSEGWWSGSRGGQYLVFFSTTPLSLSTHSSRVPRIYRKSLSSMPMLIAIYSTQVKNTDSHPVGRWPWNPEYKAWIRRARVTWSDRFCCPYMMYSLSQASESYRLVRSTMHVATCKVSVIIYSKEAEHGPC
jgi:hypothetical protein